MITKIKRIALVITIAVLFTIFIFSLTNAIYPRPDYDDYCRGPAARVVPEEIKADTECYKQIECEKGFPECDYDEEGNAINPRCNTCHEEFEEEEKKYNMVLFFVASIVGVVAVLFGLYYRKKDEFWEIVKGGLILGGLISLFTGTQIYYQDMARFLKPIVILIELFIVLLVTRKVIIKKKKR